MYEESPEKPAGEATERLDICAADLLELAKNVCL